MMDRVLSPVRRLVAMDSDERRFRVTCELRKLSTRAQWSASRPQWDRGDLSRLLAPATPSDSQALREARRALAARDWSAAHRALAAHFTERTPAFPLDGRGIDHLAARIRARFPDAPAESVARAGRVLDGKYDILGYTALPFGSPPRWDYDPVHDRRAPAGFWSAVPYLAPPSGDHKIIWEVNRHQHFLALGRAFSLTGDTRYYDEFVTQLESWLQANPPLTGVNWASMLELAFRSLSWLWALHFFAPAAAQGDATPWTIDLLVGIDRQLTHVEHNLSRYFSPNTHLSGEALALYVGGMALPELAASARRAVVGREVLLNEIDRQIRSDGGHAELSAHYHRYSTDFYLLALLVARAARDSAAERFEKAALRQARFLRAMADDRGRLPLIGDDDGGQLFPICGREPVDCRDTLASAAAILDAPELAVSDAPEETFWLCGSALPIEHGVRSPAHWPSGAFPASGYVISRNEAGDHLVFDAGPHGFLNGGHAHSDALSIVLTVGGKPLLVDPGTATYTMDPAMRDRFRSTAMHNTVVIDGRPQSAPKGPFHWESRAQAAISVWQSGSGVDYAEGRHYGYAPLLHARSIIAAHGMGWFIVDHLVGGGDVAADAYWHVHPDWTATRQGAHGIALRRADGEVRRLASTATLHVEDGPLAAYAPAYGLVVSAPCFRGHSTGGAPRSVLTFISADVSSADFGSDISIADVVVDESPGAGWHAAAFSVTFGATSAIVLSAIERTAQPAANDARPDRVWRAGGVSTDARAAVVFAGRGRTEAVLINGSRVESTSGVLVLAETAGTIRADLASAEPVHSVASTVHQPERPR